MSMEESTVPYLFSRSARLAPGNIQSAMAWAVAITEKVNAIAESRVSLWSTVMSPDLGRLTWTTVVEDLAVLTATDEKLLADSGYNELSAQGASLGDGSGIEDQLVRYVHADRDGVETARYATLVRAVLAPGGSVKGIELGIEIAQRAKAVTGRPTSFGASQTGVYGGVGWIALYDSIDQVQAASEALASDAGFAKLLDEKASKAYLPGQSTQTISRKIA
jgi:hypothetical protein